MNTDGSCSSGCSPPPEPSLFTRLCWQVYSWITWPWTVRQLKREGFVRTGWMEYSGPPDEQDDEDHG